MSLILDALNRAEQERSEKNHIPSLQSMHGSTDDTAPSWLQRLHLERWLIVLVVAYLVFDYVTDSASDSPAPVVAPAPDPVPVPASLPQAQPEVAPTHKTVELAPRALVEPSPPPAAAKQTLARSADRSEIESLYAAPPAADVAEPAVTESPPAVPATTVGHKKPLARREQAWTRAEDITDLSMDFRQQVPSIKYSDHLPASRPADSRVVLNGSEHQEGDQLAPGLVLKNIAAQGIVLDFQGTEFRLAAYNNWINFQ